MLLSSRVPLAWLNLTHEMRRLLIRVLGVAFAVFLMFAQLGFYNGLLDAQVQLIEQLNGEIIVVSTAHYTMAVKEPFSTRRLIQALAVPGVRAAYPLYLEYTASFWKDTDEAEANRSRSHLIRVIAFNPDQPVLANADVNAHRARLKLLYHVLLDRKSKPYYGKVAAGVDHELAEHTVHVDDTFALGIDFASDGSVIMSDITYARIFPDELTPEATLDLADLGVVRVQPGADVDAVYRAVKDILEKEEDVRVYTKKEFIDNEKEYWLRTTPIGYIFRFGLFMGFIVGFVICYQIISTDVAEHLPQYATLKAIGYSDRFLSETVLREALWLAVFGFVPGLGFSWLLYETLNWKIGIPMMLTFNRILLIFALAVVMCMASGWLALRKVKTADPAEVFA